jgi:hypothetical protein
MAIVNIQIEFDELLKAIDQLSDEQKRVLQQRINAPVESESKPLQKRVAGLGEGTIWMSDDLDDPLPDEFWLGGCSARG